MASSTINNDTSPTPPTRSYFHTTVTLQNWWLTKPQSNGKTLGVAGLTFQQNRVGRCFSSAPILKAHDFFELETVDGVFVILQGYINKDRTLESGFSPDVFDHFVIGFPHNWEEFCTICAKRVSAAECVSIAQDDGKASIEGRADFDDNSPQHCDSYTVDMESQDSEDTIFSNKTSTVRKASSLETPCEHIVKAGNAVLCEKSSVTQEFDGPGLKMSPIIRNDVDSSRESKFLGLSSRRMTRSMAKSVGSKNSSRLVHVVSDLDRATPIDPKKSKRCDILGMDNSDALSNKKADNVVDYDKSESRKTNSKFSGGHGKRSNETPRCSEDMLKMKSKRKQNDQNVDVTEDSNFASSVIDVNDDIVLMRTKMKACKRNQIEGKFSSRVDVPEKEGVDARNIINSRKTIVTQSKSQSKLTSGRSRSEISKRQPIRSPKSTSRSSKGSKERYGSANILPLESFSGKKSRSGRVLLPSLEFWRNQKLVYDEDGQVCGVQEPM